MARFYGTIQGARGPASRLGSARTGLEVSAQSYSGDIIVDLFAPDSDHSTDYVTIWVREHAAGIPTCLYNGPIRDLLEKDGQHAIVRRFAEQQLREEHS